MIDKSKSDLETRLATVETTLGNLVSPGGIFTGVIQNLNAQNAVGGRGPQVNFTHARFNQPATVEVMRNISRDPGSATVIQIYTHLVPSGTENHSYSDNDPTIIGHTVYYWVQIVLTNPDEQPILVGPVSAQA